MTKKHFIALADSIRRCNAAGMGQYSDRQLESLADFCQAQNPLFNRAQWLAYVNAEEKPKAPSYDVRVHNNGSIHLFELHTRAAKDWVNENVADANYFGTRLAVEARFVSTLVDGLREAGYVVV